MDSFGRLHQEILYYMTPEGKKQNGVISQEELLEYLYNIISEDNGNLPPVRARVFNLIQDCIKDDVPIDKITGLISMIFSMPKHINIKWIKEINKKYNDFGLIETEEIFSDFEYVVKYFNVYHPNIPLEQIVKNWAYSEFFKNKYISEKEIELDTLKKIAFLLGSKALEIIGKYE